VVPVMPEYMPIEAHCQGNRGINAVSRLKLNKKILKYSYCKENEKFAHEYLTQTKRYDGLTERFDRAKARLEAVTGEISDKQVRQATIEAFLVELKRLDGVTEFQPALWYSLVDFITVYSKDWCFSVVSDGTEIQA